MNSTLKKNRACAVIPFFNESATIKEIVARTLDIVDCVIAVDDGSTDSSAAQIKDFERVILIKLADNKGKGFALNAGFKESIKNYFEITVTIDADLQHEPELIPALLQSTGSFDIVIGNRLNSLKDMPLHRIASNKLTSYLLSVKTGQKLLDTQSGFRAYKTDVLPGILPSSSGFEAESEILINAARKNYRIGFVPVSTIYANEKSKMKSMQAIGGFIKVLMR